MAMFAPERAQRLGEVIWNADGRGQADRQHLSYYIECWSYRGLNQSQEGLNWRHGWLGDPKTPEGHLERGDTELSMWVKREVGGARHFCSS